MYLVYKTFQGRNLLNLLNTFWHYLTFISKGCTQRGPHVIALCSFTIISNIAQKYVLPVSFPVDLLLQ